MPSAPESARPVGAIQLLALGLNGIVGVGIFFVPASVAAGAPGLGAVAVFALTGLALLPAALTFATLGRRFDEDGGPVVFARAAFGDRVSFLVGWVAYVSALFSTAAVVVGLTRATLPALGLGGGLASRAAPALLVTLLAAVVASGLRLSARVWTSLTVLKLLPLVLLVGAFALAWGRFPAPAAAAPDSGWLRAALIVVFACQGFEIVPVIAGQVRSSSRAVPFATVGSLAPRHRPLRGPRPGVRHRAALARVVRGSPRGNGRGGLGNRPRVSRRRGDQRLGPRHLLRDDGHDARATCPRCPRAAGRSSTWRRHRRTACRRGPSPSRGWSWPRS